MSFEHFYQGMTGPTWASGMADRRDIAEQRSKLNVAEDRVRRLEGQVEKLRLVCRSLCEVVVSETRFTEESLMDLIDEVDGRDGKVDGRMSVATRTCPACNRNFGRDRPNCQYCGVPAERDDGLDNIV